MKIVKAALVLLLAASVGCGGKPIIPAPQPSASITLAQSRFHLGTFKFCSGSTTVQTFVVQIDPTEPTGATIIAYNFQPGSTYANADRYQMQAGGWQWLSSDSWSLDLKTLQARQLGISSPINPLVITTAGAVVGQDIPATVTAKNANVFWKWGAAVNGIVSSYTAQGFAVDKTVYSFDGVTLTMTEDYNSPGYQPFHLTTTYDANGIKSVDGDGRC